ncbi:MAG: nucleotidyl transferase AbiEii/AbiGii toxin family protein [Chloroflexi bacterium]|nr:nucleotidyl transferase AbiEii/AbiGii toxin family protein [Chloroflexota bacterium]
MSELFWNAISADMRAILTEFARTEMGAKFYLAGGTALSLQLGHRLSVDLDFFSPTEDIPSIRPALERALTAFDSTLADSAWGNLVYLARNVRVGFYGYGYPLVAPLVEAQGARLASIEDIALMKLDALLSRAARKDFYDLYFICQKITLRQALDLALQKYPSIRDFEAQTVKRLTYFELAEQDADPTILRPVDWEAVKRFFIQQAKEIGRSWLE